MKPISVILLALILTCGMLLPSCESNDDFREEMAESGLNPQAFGGLEPLDCAGHIRYPACYSILSQTSLAGGGYQVVIQVDTSTYSRLPNSCKCKKLSFCVYFNYWPEVTTELAAGPANVEPEECEVLVYDEDEGYIGYGDLLSPLMQKPVTPEVRMVCDTAGNQLVFRVGPGFPGTFNIQQTIIAVGGLCIIDNIADPAIFDPSGATACQI